MSNFLGDLWNNTAGGLLWKPLKKATGMTDAQMIGAAGLALAAPYALPALGASGAAAGASGASAGMAPLTLGGDVATTYGAVDAAPVAAEGASGGLLGNLSSLGKPAMTALQGASMAKGLLGQQQPIQGAQLNKQAPQFSGLLTQPQDQEAQRRQQYQQYVQNIGGRNGLAY